MDILYDENWGASSVAQPRIVKFAKTARTSFAKEDVLHAKNLNEMNNFSPGNATDLFMPPAPALLRGHVRSRVPSLKTVMNYSILDLPAAHPTKSSIFPLQHNSPRLQSGTKVPFDTNSSSPLLADESILDLCCLGDGLVTGFDISPLRTNYIEDDLYDNETIALEWKLFQILSTEQTQLRQYPRFVKEHQMNDAARRSRWYHYPLYYVLGIDTTGFFQLKEEFQWYQNHPWSSFDQDSLDISELEPPHENIECLSAFEACSEYDDSGAQFSDTSVRSLDQYLP